MVRRIALFVLMAAGGLCLVASSRAQQKPPVWYGLLHAHTYFSDGSGTPEQAYDRAEAQGLDFFAVTPHNHASAEGLAGERRDGILIATNTDLYNATGTVTFQREGMAETERSVVNAATDATDASFVALYGQEVSIISSGDRHQFRLRVFEVSEALPSHENW